MLTRILLDTDIGTDVDDCLALALVLASPELKLEGITCVYGDVNLRARIVQKLLQLRGITGVPVAIGARQPLLAMKAVYWEGHEGQGILEDGDHLPEPVDEFAPDFIIRMVMENPSKIHLVAIGPLTNIALALVKEPRLAQNIAHLTVMGGVIRGMNRLDLPYAEHNIRCDPEAAHLVFASGMPMTVVPLDITTQVRVRVDGLARIQQAGTLFHQAVAQQLANYPRFQAQGWTALHDPLAIATIIDPTLVHAQSVHMDVEIGGHWSTGATWARLLHPGEESSTKLVTSVEIDRFESFFVERVAR